MKNGWIVPPRTNNEDIYSYYCKCSAIFTTTSISKNQQPEAQCPQCANEYFINTIEWENAQGTKIWKEFFWETEVINTSDDWIVNLFFKISSLYFQKTQLS
jgi:hypothetical protein